MRPADFLDLIDVAPWRLAAVCLVATLSVILSFAPHLYVWWLASSLLGDAPVSAAHAAWAGIAVLAALALRYTCAGIASVASHNLAFDVQYDLRRRLAQKLAAVPMGFLDSQPRGAMRKLAVDDVEALEDGLAHLVPETVATVVTPVLLVTVMFVVDWRMALVALSPALLSFVLLGHLMKKGKGVISRYQAGLAHISAIASETVSAFPLVKTFGADNIILGRAAAAFETFRNETGEWIRRALIPSTWFQIMTTATPAVVLPAGLWLYLDGNLDLSTLLFFLIISIALGNVFQTLSTLSNRLIDQRSILARLQAQLFAAELDVAEQPQSATGSAIEFDGVSFGYDDRPVLSDISFAGEPGETIALVGPSGSGKSTITRLIARFWDVSKGAVRIGGIDVRQMTPEEVNAQVAMVFQDVFLFSRSIRDNIRLGRPNAGDTEVEAAARAAEAHGFIMDLPGGYDTVLGENGAGLSGGQRQRLSIARAILKNAPILVLDEATAYADPQNELLVQKAISALSRGKTVFIIAHRLSTIVDADQVIVLDKGSIVDRGRHGALLDRCVLYRQLWADHLGARDFTFGDKRTSPKDDAPKDDAPKDDAPKDDAVMGR